MTELRRTSDAVLSFKGLTHHDFLTASTRHGGAAAIPRGMEVAAAEVTLDSHYIEFEPSKRISLCLSEKCEGRVAAHVGPFIWDERVADGALSLTTANTKQVYDFRGRTTNTLLSIDPMLFERVAELDPKLDAKARLEPRLYFFRPNLQAVVKEQFRVLASGEAGWRVLAESLTLQLAYEILAAFGAPSHRRDGERGLSAAEARRLTEFIDAELATNFNLSEMARALGREPYNLIRACREATGLTPHQYVIQRRISRARQYLEQTDNQIVDIALATGFASQSHLTSTFTKHVGVPPGAYRRSWRA
ncbi:MAG: AraC family transcriptional regulator [Pseudomonadota bacterium]